jgi:2-keto-4-pentenoate hydratase/2-oxohepta-3-ene-1,7-dioic acid hydratase in catechol pathway
MEGRSEVKLVTFRHDGKVCSGVLEGATVRPLVATGGDDALVLIASGDAPKYDDATIPLSEVTLLAPLLHPPRIFGIGLNYREHAAESKMAVQAVPTVFMKLPSSICGPDADVMLPINATQTDYEAELAVVIGKPGFRIRPEDWEQHVFGYTIVNDVSARDVQLATSQWTLGKSFPTFTPMGPVIVTREEIADPHALDIRLTLSGEVMQNANTRDLIFRIPELIAHISGIVPLEAGDIISTGTPPGVGLGRTPQRWLRDGEEMVIEIEGIGALRNRTRNE